MDDNNTVGDDMRSLKDNVYGVVDLGVVLIIGIAFVGLIIIAYIAWTIRDQLWASDAGTGFLGANTVAGRAAYNKSLDTAANITTGFDNAVNLILIAITIFVLAIAISALLMLRGR